MRSRRACGNTRVKVEVESRIEHEIVRRNLRDVDFMVAFGMDFSEIVFVQEVVSDDQPFFVFRERDVVRA